MENLQIDNMEFNSGVDQARSASRKRGRPGDHTASGGKGGKGGKSVGKAGGKSGKSKGKSGTHGSAGARGRGGGKRVQAAISKVKSAAANSAPQGQYRSKPSAERVPGSESAKQAAAGRTESARLSKSVSGLLEEAKPDDGEDTVQECHVAIPYMNEKQSSDLRLQGAQDYAAEHEERRSKYFDLQTLQRSRGLLCQVQQLDCAAHARKNHDANRQVRWRRSQKQQASGDDCS